jgi:hypothetical protein
MTYQGNEGNTASVKTSGSEWRVEIGILEYQIAP